MQSKARTFADLAAFSPSKWREFLAPEDQAKGEELDRAFSSLEAERHGWRLAPVVAYHATGSSLKQIDAFPTAEEERAWRERRTQAEKDQLAWERQMARKYPEVAPVMGPQAQRIRPSVSAIQKRLREGEAVLELLRTDDGLMAFLLRRDRLETHRWALGEPMSGDDGPTLEEWEAEVAQVLAVGDSSPRHVRVQEGLTQECLVRWGDLLYGPFVETLAGVQRLFVGPHGVLAQVPLGILPFPDGIEREVALLPSAMFLETLRKRRGKARRQPRVRLGVVAADPVEGQPLLLQREEVRRLEALTRKKKTLAGDGSGQEPTLTNLQEWEGWVGCLIFSCHGKGPQREDDGGAGSDLGTLSLGTRKAPEPVNGRMLLESQWKMEAEVVLTSACLTGQVALEHPGEWLGLPMALQTAWRARAMALTLWEVEELPAMIWVVTLAKGLTQGLSAGQAQRRAQKTVRTATCDQVELGWLGPALDTLREVSPGEALVLERQWRRHVGHLQGGDPAFADPVYWGPFVLVGDSTTSIA